MSTEIFGHTGKLLRVNLSNGRISVEEPDQSYYKHYLGGQGIMIQTLLTEVAPKADPLGPENKLIFVPWNFAKIRDAVSAITGWPVTTWKLMKAAERGITMMRIFNLREGFTREDDKLPNRFYNPP